MKLCKSSHQGQAGGTIMEAIFSVAIAGVFFTSLFAGVSQGMLAVQAVREDLRATQIITEKFETIRLYSWDQINTPGFIPDYFAEPFLPNTPMGQAEGGDPEVQNSFIFQGTMTISNPPASVTYVNEMKQVTVEVIWQSSSRWRTNSATSMISRYGLQNYVY